MILKHLQADAIGWLLPGGHALKGAGMSKVTTVSIMHETCQQLQSGCCAALPCLQYVLKEPPAVLDKRCFRIVSWHVCDLLQQQDCACQSAHHTQATSEICFAYIVSTRLPYYTVRLSEGA